MITIDHREPREIERYLTDYGVSFERKLLSCGDYIINNFCIERKTWTDFFESYKDGRLFKQLRQLATSQTGILILEEPHFEHIEKKEFFYTILIKILFCYNIRLLFTQNMAHTAAVLSVLSKNSQYTNFIPEHKIPQKTMTSQQRKKALLLCFPNIGKKKAERILQHFGTLHSFFSAPAPELEKIGIGRKTRNGMRELFYQ